MSRKFNAILGLGALAAFGFASSAFAQCPASPVPPWSSQSVLGGALSIDGPGLNGTSCKLNSRITANIGGATAAVRDNTPADEPSYRAQFWINADALTGLNLIQGAKIFGASTDNPFGGVSDLVRLTVIGNATGTAKTLGIFTACEGQPSNQCSASTPLPAGNVSVEIAWERGANTTLRVWVNNGNEASPTLTIPNVNNASWGGVDFASLGLSTPTPGFRSSQANRDVVFDEFDSRRQTFIGL